MASEWNRDIVREWGYEPYLIYQAVDTAIFNPLACKRRRAPCSDSRLRVFSGGKAEYRKGQDIVLSAFALFSQHHRDAVLVTAWDSPWPELAQSFAESPLGVPPGGNLGIPNFHAWAQRAGVATNQFVSVPPTPNSRMIDILSDIDVAIFPNRAEGGTNQVAMECIACGIPTIISPTTGHATLVNTTDVRWADGAEAFAEALCHAERGRLPGCDLPVCFTWPARVESLSALLLDLCKHD